MTTYGYNREIDRRWLLDDCQDAIDHEMRRGQHAMADKFMELITPGTTFAVRLDFERYAEPMRRSEVLSWRLDISPVRVHNVEHVEMYRYAEPLFQYRDRPPQPRWWRRACVSAATVACKVINSTEAGREVSGITRECVDGWLAQCRADAERARKELI